MERRVATRMELVGGASHQRGPGPDGGPGGEAPGFFLSLLPIFEHGLQFRFNEITYFLEHSFI